MGVDDWSKTAADNDDADSEIDFSEGQAPGTVNDSARELMESVAEWRDDTGGQLSSGGSSNTYTLTTNQTYTAYADGMRVHFVANHSNDGAATLNVDTLGAKKIRKVTTAGETALVGNEIISAGHYIVQYDASADAASGAFILLNPTQASGVEGADVDITGTTAETTVAAGDEILVRDVSGSANRKMTVANVMKYLTDATAETGIALDDVIIIKDTSESSAPNTITVENLLKAVNLLTEDTDPAEDADFILVYDTSASAVKKVKPENLVPAAQDSNVPVGSVLPYAGASAPTGWLLCYGQAISRTTYSDLFTAISTTYGAGDGSTTFNVPDLRGRVPAGQDDMGGTSANRLTNQTGGLNGDTLGATGGAETHTLTTAQIPAHSHDVIFATSPTGGGNANVADDGSTSGGSQTFASEDTGDGGAHNNVQPTIILNYIIYAAA